MRKYAQRFSFIASATYRNSFLSLFSLLWLHLLKLVVLASLLALLLSLPWSRPTPLVIGRALVHRHVRTGSIIHLRGLVPPITENLVSKWS